MEKQPIDVNAAMRATYDHYYSSAGYRQRYPEPNQATLEYLMAHGAGSAANILDFGCGNGRYAMALLGRSQARITGYDISPASLAEFAALLQLTPYRERVALVDGEVGNLRPEEPYDLVLMLFGVLSHVGARAERIKVLRRLRALMKAEGKLILSVPSVYRRRPLELLEFSVRRRLGRAGPPQDEAGNIFFSRAISGKPLQFFYHLYSPADLRDDLAQAGFKVAECRPESLLPEWLVTQSTLARRLDKLVLPILPAALGYGIRVVAYPS